MFYVGIFAAISFGTAAVSVAAVLVKYTGSLRASRILFERLLDQVVHATMRWHDITPQGEAFEVVVCNRALTLPNQYRPHMESFQQGRLLITFSV